MHNAVTATHACTQVHAEALPASETDALPSGRRFAPLITKAVQFAIASVSDELGRPLLAVFVPDGDLL